MPTDPFSLSPESVTRGQLYAAIQSISIRQDQFNSELTALRKELTEQKEATQHLVAAWNAGGFMLSVVKVLGIIATAVLSSLGAYNIFSRFTGS